MEVGIPGTGVVGQTIGVKLAELGHEARVARVLLGIPGLRCTRHLVQGVSSRSPGADHTPSRFASTKIGLVNAKGVKPGSSSA